MQATLAIDSRNRIGEAPVWDARQARLLWSDHESGIIHEARSDGTGGWQETRRWNLHRPIAAALPRRHGGFVVAAGLDILLIDEATGQSTPFVHLDADPLLLRWNEAKCDSQGRLWAGTLATDLQPRAALYRIDPDGSVVTLLERVVISNGLDWSLDGKTLYYVDSLTLTVDAFDVDAQDGTLSNRRSLISISRGEGGFNGMAVDHEGCLWVALTGGGEVRRYAPTGALLERVTLPTPGATSCAFGGMDGQELFITSRSGRLHEQVGRLLGVPPEKMEQNGFAPGGLFVCRTSTRGAPATPFAG